MQQAALLGGAATGGMQLNRYRPHLGHNNDIQVSADDCYPLVSASDLCSLLSQHIYEVTLANAATLQQPFIITSLLVLLVACRMKGTTQPVLSPDHCQS